MPTPAQLQNVADKEKAYVDAYNAATSASAVGAQSQQALIDATNYLTRQLPVVVANLTQQATAARDTAQAKQIADFTAAGILWTASNAAFAAWQQSLVDAESTPGAIEQV